MLGVRQLRYGWSRLQSVAFAALLALLVPLQPIAAQTASEPEPYRNIDPFGVDLSSGTFNFSMTDVVGGTASTGVDITRTWVQSGWKDAYAGHLKRSGSTITIVRGEVSEVFNLSGGTWVPAKANGATLVQVAGGPGGRFPGFTYTDSGGTVILYQAIGLNVFTPEDDYPDRYKISGPNGTCRITSWQDPQLSSQLCAVPITIASPAGDKLDLVWREEGTCAQYVVSPFDQGWECDERYRLEKIADQSAYAADMRYATSFYDYTSTWWRRTVGLMIDRSVESCPSYAADCSTSQNWPDADYSVPSSGTQQVVDQYGRTWTFTFDTAGRMTAITRPGASSPTTTIVYGTDGKVSSVTKDGVTRTYSWSTVAGNTVVSYSGGPGGSGSVTTDPSTGRPTTATNATSNTVSHTYDANNRLKRTTWPEGNYVEYTYDARGNVTQLLQVPKSGSGLANISTTASFDASCTNPAKCNKPNYTIDAAGNRTDYTYGATHGQVTRVQLPAPTGGQPRPQIDYAYTALYAKEKNASGVLVNVATPQYKLTQITRCATAATCAGTASETKVTLAYNTPNLQLTSVTVAAGNGSVSSTTSYVYDASDNVIAVDGPLAGTGDTEHRFYDAENRPVGGISADPDGAGGNPRLATRVTYDSAGRVWKVESGTATGTTQASLDSMTVLQSAETTFDSDGRTLTETLKDTSAAKVSLVQYGYDSAGRLQCTAVRMNPGVYGSLPSSACTPGTTGSFGPDRITRLHYDAAGRVTRQESGVGTAAAADDAAMTYTANGAVATATDGEANRTTYEYDGFDRLRKTRYPSPAQGARTSSTTDYEQLSYDAASHVTQRRLRDGQTIAFDYDDLNRMIAMAGATVADITVSYDLLNRPLSITYSSSGQSVANAWDALGRLTGQTSPQGTVGYQYDAASRRTRITWPDGFYAAYDHDALGRVTKIRENGASSGVGVLASYTYDNLGRRASVSYGNGTSRTYAYDAASRLAGLNLDLAGTSADLTLGKVGGVGTPIGYNPASQITSLVRSNDAYAWDGHANVDRAYVANGLNQYTTVGSDTPGYDARGNLTVSNGVNYSYNGHNQLTSVSGAIFANLAYDPIGRLYQLITGGGTSRFLYDGGMMIGEYNSSNALVDRYVPGPGVDEPIVWYEGSGTANRRFLQTDERGSIVAVSNASGGLLSANAYDEYGIPAAGNLGRFGYTGQAWLDEIGLSYYKARMYSPTLGRFMQTDPIGYADGMNLYNYVGGDPVNFVDPTGLFDVPDACAPRTENEIVACANRETSPFIVSSPLDRIKQGPCDAMCQVAWFADRQMKAFLSAAADADSDYGRGPQNGACSADYVAVGDGSCMYRGAPPENEPNGCGAEVGDAIPDIFDACAAHDICYGTLGSIKAQCDSAFLRSMLAECAGRMVCSLAAQAYYTAVDRRGQIPFNIAQYEARWRRDYYREFGR